MTSEYIGQIKERISVDVTLKNIYWYDKPSYTGYGTESHEICIMVDDEGNVFKWDTTSAMRYNDKQNHKDVVIQKDSKVKIKATVKDHKEYKGTKQTVLTRVVVTEIIEMGMSPKEIEEMEKRKKELAKSEQLATVQEGDVIVRMPYRQYKEHYADCETVIYSYDSGVNERGRRYDDPKIDVIIRKGRLKNSGTRGKHYKYFFYTNENNELVAYKAICEENAYERVQKEYPENNWKFDRVEPLRNY